MSRGKLGVLFLAVVFLLCGCSKEASLEGKLVDGKGQPLSGVKVIANQVQPIKGYEHFEEITVSDGTFKFKKLFRSSEYVLSPYLKAWSAAPLVVIEYEAGNLRTFYSQEGWTSAAKLTVSSGTGGETTLLKSPIMVAPALAGVEGKIQYWTKKPVAGLKIVASQEAPVKGYEEFETTVDPDGAFKFEKLLPESKYVLKPISDFLTSYAAETVVTGKQGETLKMTWPINVRFFTVSKDGVVEDLETGLEWYEGPDRDTDWDQASDWVDSLNVAGGGWRMPAPFELSALYQKGSGERNMPKPFKTKGCWVWSRNLRDLWSAVYFDFNCGVARWYFRDSPNHRRAFAVRSRK